MHISLICADDDVWASGIRSISAALRKAGHQTTLIFAGSSGVSVNESTIREIASLTKDSEIIGISSMSRGSKTAKALIKGLRVTGNLLVWGGVHPSIYPEDCVVHADIVCRGEGEGFMLDLTERVTAGTGFADIPNGAYLSNGKLILNEPRPLISDLDSMPFPDFRFQDEYYVNKQGSFETNIRMKDSARVLFSGSRGCNNNCAYCSNSQLKTIYKDNKHYARKMSIPAFINAAKEYRSLFPNLKEFYFTDEDFFDRPVEEMEELARMYPGQIGIPFEVMASPRQITDEKVGLAVKAGMWRIDIGLESGSERVRREVFNRYVNDKRQLQAALAINRHAGVISYYFLILGNPYEEQQDLLNGISLLQKLPSPFFLRAYNLVFLPGTRLFNRAREDGIIGGVHDSASELDFLAGFHHNGYEWKQKNLYLDSLISLMVGKSTRLRMGYVPRIFIPVLTSKPVITFCRRNPEISETMMNLANIGLKIRRTILGYAHSILPDYRVVYSLRSVLKKW